MVGLYLKLEEAQAINRHGNKTPRRCTGFSFGVTSRSRFRTIQREKRSGVVSISAILGRSGRDFGLDSRGIRGRADTAGTGKSKKPRALQHGAFGFDVNGGPSRRVGDARAPQDEDR